MSIDLWERNILHTKFVQLVLWLIEHGVPLLPFLSCVSLYSGSSTWNRAADLILKHLLLLLDLVDPILRLLETVDWDFRPFLRGKLRRRTTSIHQPLVHHHGPRRRHHTRGLLTLTHYHLLAVVILVYRYLLLLLPTLITAPSKLLLHQLLLSEIDTFASCATIHH